MLNINCSWKKVFLNVYTHIYIFLLKHLVVVVVNIHSHIYLLKMLTNLENILYVTITLLLHQNLTI